MTHHHTHHGNARRSGFTLIELLVVFVITLVLLTLVLSGLNRATEAGRRTATQQSVSSLAKAVDQFKQDFGFLPPLVHDGMVISSGRDELRPAVYLDSDSPKDGPTYLVTPPSGAQYQVLVVWNEGLDNAFFRGRSVDGPFENAWDDEDSWNDRRYSKYSLAYYLTGVLDKDIDGVRGPGMARPIIDGSFLGIGYPVGTVRERFEPIMAVERRGARVVNGYVEPRSVPEHTLSANAVNLQDAEMLRSEYEDYQRPSLYSFVDSFGTAFRYYRWEPQSFVNSELDLNIPPVLIDPVIYAGVRNDPMNLDDGSSSLLGENAKLRNARYAIVSAGPDGFFGTENIETIADFLRVDVPTSTDDHAALRQQVWVDNAVEVGS